MKTCALIIGLAAMLLSPLPGLTQKSIETRHGHVVAKREIKGDSNVAKGAIIGGIVGLVTASGKSSDTKIKRAAGGAILGGVIANQVDKSKRHWQYTIRFPGGDETRLELPDDRLNLGDCAAVHQDLQQTSVEYASDYFCRPEASREAISHQPHMEPISKEQQREDRKRAKELRREERKRAEEQRREQEEWSEDPCQEAKRRLLDAEDPQEIEVLVRKVEVICDQ